MARKEDYLGHLAKVPLFSLCGKGELRQVARRSTKLNLEEGRALVQEGSVGHEFFVILDGRAEVTREGKPVAELGAGDFVGELSLLDPGPRDATVIAVTPMTVMVLTPAEFETVLTEAPGMTRKLLAAMAYRLRDLDTARF
jgi:CRP/FNR family cyclic AMP-dependent transcriptional regulator